MSEPARTTTASAEAGALASDAALEAEMDRVLMETFPASDPPQWDSIAARRPSARRPRPAAARETRA